MKLIDNSLPSFRVPGRLPQWLVWSIAICLFIASWIGVDIWARKTAMDDLAKHTDRWDEFGILQQETSYTCVPASIVMLLKSQGIDTTTYEVAKIAGTDIRGTGSSGIIRAGRHFGFSVNTRRMNFHEFYGAGLPAIIEFRHEGINHAAFVRPVSDVRMIEVTDPIQGLLYFKKKNADEYFGSEKWRCFLFR
ncbi:MAG TPA: hypothetical protein ENN67_05720 [Firmicutes bacterium]|nr:hypothetical protein [Bacillota bacterium]